MKQLRSIIAIALALAVVPLWGASAAADRTAELTPGQTFTWEGSATPAINANYHTNIPETGQAPVDGAVQSVAPVGKCTKDPNTYCESVLLSFSNPVPEADADGKLTKAASITLTNAKGDVDLMVYSSDAEGTKGASAGTSTGPNTGNTSLDELVNLQVVTTRPTLAKPTQADAPVKYYLVEIVYYSAAGFTGTARF